MSTSYQIPKLIKRYVKRLEVDYRHGDHKDLARVLSASRVRVVPETGHDNWNGGRDGHDVIFEVPEEIIGLISLDRQGDIQTKVAQDLNKAASGVGSEYIEGVHFEYLDPDEPGGDVGIVPSDVAIQRIWRPDSLRLFISHRDTSKDKAHGLASRLDDFAVSSFVAHDAIEPDEEWQAEIERAMRSMDVMLAFITDDFFESAWTNQEVGFALGRNIPVIRLKLEDADPTGFIGRRQAIRGSINDPAASSKDIFDVILKRLDDSPRLNSVLIAHFAASRSFVAAEARSKLLMQRELSGPDEVKAIVETFNANRQIYECWALVRNSEFLDWLNKYSFQTYRIRDSKLRPADPLEDDDLPF